MSPGVYYKVINGKTMNIMCYLPGKETPERECWYIDMGAVDRNFFTTQAMVKAAP